MARSSHLRYAALVAAALSLFLSQGTDTTPAGAEPVITETQAGPLGLPALQGANGANANCNTLGADPTDKNLNSEHEVMNWAEAVILPCSCMLMLALVVGALMEKFEFLKCIPESAIIILIGCVVGCIYFYSKEEDTTLEKKEATMKMFETLNSTLLNLVLLPIIIFESGWSLRQKDFAAQFPYILVFAMLGTVISTSTIAGLLLWQGSITSVRVAFAFACLISATDPVATLSTYSSLKVQPLLNIMVFGESTINDAVAIVLFKVLNNNAFMGVPAQCSVGPHPSGWDISLEVATGVIVIFLGSIAVGVILAFIYIVILRIADMRHSETMEVLYIASSPFLTFSVAESVGMSGIVAVLFNAIMMSIYAKPHLSNSGLLLGSFFIKQLASLADMSVFLLVGIDVALINSNNIGFGFWVMLFCLIARFCSTVPCAFLVNCFKKCALKGKVADKDMKQLELKHILMMWHAGLRGGIALVLCLELGDWVEIEEGQGTKQMLRNATFMVIVVFLVVFGGTTELCLTKLGVKMGEDVDPDELYKIGAKDNVGKKCVGMIDGILRPILVGPQRAEELEDEHENIANHADDLIEKLLQAEHSQGRHLKNTDGDGGVSVDRHRDGFLGLLHMESDEEGEDSLEDES